MTSRVRYALLAFAALGLVASVLALYVHYRLLTDPTYSSFCDVSETVSCQQVFQSEYGTAFGIPVAAGGAIWSGLVLALAAVGLRDPRAERAGRIAAYVFVLATIGLAAVFYFGYASFFVLQQVCVLCMTMYASVIGVFVLSAKSAGPLGALPARLGDDLGAIGQSPAAATLAIAWLAGSMGLVLWFPREQAAEAAVASAAAPAPAVPLETLTPEQIAEWERWLAAQPRRDEALPTGDTKVLLLKFNDFQCPACRQAFMLYGAIIEQYEAKYPGAFRFENRDFPLEAECGAGGIHGAACEAAVAVRLAARKDRHDELERVLYERQASMTRETVKEALEEVAQIPGDEFDAQYATVLEDVRADAQLGQRLGVSGTPTYYLNGIQLPSLRPAYLAAAIEWALRDAGVAPSAPAGSDSSS